MSEAAVHTVIHNAIKATGAIVQIKEEDFRNLVAKMDRGLVIEKPGGTFLSSYKYSTSYKGFIFFCRTKNPITIPSRLEKIQAKYIWTPQ